MTNQTTPKPQRDVKTLLDRIQAEIKAIFALLDEQEAKR